MPARAAVVALKKYRPGPIRQRLRRMLGKHQAQSVLVIHWNPGMAAQVREFRLWRLTVSEKIPGKIEGIQNRRNSSPIGVPRPTRTSLSLSSWESMNIHPGLVSLADASNAHARLSSPRNDPLPSPSAGAPTRTGGLTPSMVQGAETTGLSMPGADWKIPRACT